MSNKYQIRNLLICITLFSGICETGSAQQSMELNRYPAQEARQAVAVDKDHFYAIDNNRIGKYDKVSGKQIKVWESTGNEAMKHLNSGVVLNGKLYCAHSNYPDIPMVSSIEIWDTRTMQHIGNHSFGIFAGSATWIDFYDGSWWVVFAHYTKLAAQTGKDSRWTTLIRFDETWQQKESWIFPKTVIDMFQPYSNSGGAWGENGYLYCTGHDKPELYVLALPQTGSVLHFIDTIQITNQGQGIAWDRSEKNILYSISRKTRQVIISRIE